MPTTTYTPLASLTLGSSAASVTFSSISQAYRDLVLVMTGTTSSNATPKIQINSDTGSNYYWVRAFGDGSTASSDSSTDTALKLGGFVDANQMNFIVNFMDYSVTDKHKSVMSRGNNAGTNVMMVANRWANTSAITSFNISNVTWNSGSTFSLFGIAS